MDYFALCREASPPRFVVLVHLVPGWKEGKLQIFSPEMCAVSSPASLEEVSPSKHMLCALACIWSECVCNMCALISPVCSSGLISHRPQLMLQSQCVFSNSFSRTSRTVCLSSTSSVLEPPSLICTLMINCRKSSKLLFIHLLITILPSSF